MYFFSKSFIGLQDQPGFIPGTNYLLPWDVTVKLEQKERWPALWEGKRPLSLKAKKAIRGKLVILSISHFKYYSK